MAILKVKNPKSATVSPLANKTRVQLHLRFGAPSQYESIDIELSSEGALRFAKAIQDVLSSDNTPSPPSRARAVGRPKLRIVKK
jgi:hypothetical protein